MTETEELVIRRDALKEALEKARAQTAAREDERVSALGELEAQRAALQSEVAALEEEVAALEAKLVDVDDAWRTATREAAAAKAHLAGL
jgi:predicted RNase H-like nuclease (RuvC/YqgF family)